MHEEVLKQFFDGDATADQLAADVAGSKRQLSGVASVVDIEDMQDEYIVTRDMAMRLCDVVLRKELPPEALAAIGFCLTASDKFTYDGDVDPVLAEVVADWSCPEVNYPLTLENVGRFRNWLSGEEPYPEKPSKSRSNGRLVSFTEKNSLKPWWRKFRRH